MSETLLSARDLSVGYHGRPLLREICLQVHPGEILTLIGPNGAGKSTILNSLIGQLRLLGGQVSLLGRDIVRLSEREIARSLSVMMTGRAQPDRMTCWEVAAAGRYPYTGRLGILGPGDRAAVRAALERVRALELRDAPFDQISDGQRQRGAAGPGHLSGAGSPGPGRAHLLPGPARKAGASGHFEGAGAGTPGGRRPLPP
ncbi:MAG: ABC transporter ATP-binding protein [Lawsonibacter sp.]